MKEEWLFRGALVPIDAATTAALVAEIKRLIDVVGGLVLQQGPEQAKSSVDKAVNAMAQPEQEPVAWMTINEYGEEDDIHYENPEGHLMEGWTYKPLYTHPPTVQPAQGAIYGMNQDDWKNVVAAIAKVRDGRGMYLACRPADVFQDWFLALGIAKVKDRGNT